MKIKHGIGALFFVMLLPFGVGQTAFCGEFSQEINAADKKVILEQYDDAKEIYQKIIKSADFSVVEAYAHYKLGSLYKRQYEPEKARQEYEMGLQSLKRAGEADHQVGKYLAQALQGEFTNQ